MKRPARAGRVLITVGVGVGLTAAVAGMLLANA